MLQRLSGFASSLPRLQQICCQHKCLHTNASAASFSFASATSSHGNLYKAIYECVNTIEEQLPLRDVHFCQLLVSTKHVSTLAHAPQCLLDNLNRTLDLKEGPHTTPVIIGGALQSVYGSGVSSDGTPGVSILAGSLPGVQLMPFHVRDASLPPFTTQQWASLLQRNTSHSISSATSSTGSSDAPGNHSNACTAIVFSAPHFTDVESFLQRLSSVLPNIPVVGGVTEKDAWIDTENEYGALFCGTDVHCNGAVGVVMQGPLVMRHILLQSGRPAGRTMIVTEAADNVILALDNRPVHDSFVELLHSLPKADQKKELLLGISDSSTTAAGAAAGSDNSTQMVARSMHLSSTTYGRPVLVVAANEVPAGACVQLLVRDFDLSHQQQRESLTAVAEQLPVTGVNRPSQVALLSFCCVALPHSESNIVAEVLPQVPFGGGRVQGEFAGPHYAGSQAPNLAAGYVGAAQGAQLHSYAASFALLHHDSTLSGTDQGTR